MKKIIKFEKEMNLFQRRGEVLNRKIVKHDKKNGKWDKLYDGTDWFFGCNCNRCKINRQKIDRLRLQEWEFKRGYYICQLDNKISPTLHRIVGDKKFEDFYKGVLK